MNILNIGRLKLGVGSLGSCKAILEEALTYTSQREQFDMPINQFGLIQEKLANMAIKAYAVESASYRSVGHIQKLIDSIDHSAEDAEKQILKSIEEYSIECAIMKVFGSEVLDYAADEGLQCLGGYGFIQEYPMEGYYRNSRINRIYEGTNEINRLVITGMLMKKGLKGELDLMGAIKAIQKEITDFPTMAEETGELLEHERRVLENAKKAVLLIAGAAIQKFDKGIEMEQEILAMVADCLIEIYALESIILRVLKIAGDGGEDKVGIHCDIARVYCLDAVLTIDGKLKMAAAATYEGDDLRVLLGAIKRFVKYTPPNVKEMRRNVAKHLIDAGKYQF
jgi:alkylation response protein AidB-like acyl-CoA dehydrogenase